MAKDEAATVKIEVEFEPGIYELLELASSKSPTSVAKFVKIAAIGAAARRIARMFDAA